MPKRRAIVIGGSLGGLLAANMLHSIGWQVDVFERTGDDLAARGAGIGTHEELFVVLNRIGVTVDDSIGVVPLSRTCLDSSGNPVASIQRPRILSSWARLYRALKDAFPEPAYHFSKSLSHFEDKGDTALLELTPKIYFQAIYDLESPRMALGRIALLGDAAFVARPHCAMGVTKAGLDAESLADALAGSGDDIAAGLARYDEEAGEFGRRAVARARYLGAHLEAQHKPRESRTPAELSRDPEKWIRESGARLRDVPELLELVQARRR